MTTQLFYSGEEANFRQFLENCGADQFILLADANTNGFCVPVFKELFPFLSSSPLIVIPQGEENKTIKVCTLIWEQLIRFEASRKTVLISIGGGVLSDIGGFAASVYKRGIRFVNIPTTLLSMVDACYGGKTGIDFLHAKNLIGTFQLPIVIFCNPYFILTLDQRILKSGIAEIIKHALLSSSAWWHQLQHASIESCCSIETIKHCLQVKKEFTDEDLLDEGTRQSLNLGHSVGHAIESYSLQTTSPLLHGEAIILGLIHELKISQQIFQLPSQLIEELISLKNKFFPDLKFEYTMDDIKPFLIQDKKNHQGLRMSLLRNIGEVEIQVKVTIEQIQNSFQ